MDKKVLKLPYPKHTQILQRLHVQPYILYIINALLSKLFQQRGLNQREYKTPTQVRHSFTLS